MKELEAPERKRAPARQTVAAPPERVAARRTATAAPRRSEPVRAPDGTASAVHFRVGTDLPATLARTARALTQQGEVGPAQLRRLQRVARRHGPVTPMQEMFLAGLLDAGNRRELGRTDVAPGAMVGFSLTSIQAGMPAVRGLGRAPMPRRAARAAPPLPRRGTIARAAEAPPKPAKPLPAMEREGEPHRGSRMDPKLLDHATAERLRIGDRDPGFNLNVAVVKYERDGKVGYIAAANDPTSSLHSEEVLVGQLWAADRGLVRTKILEVYSEREPCPGKCRPLLDRLRGQTKLDFPIYHSVPHRHTFGQRAEILTKLYARAGIGGEGKTGLPTDPKGKVTPPPPKPKPKTDPPPAKPESPADKAASESQPTAKKPAKKPPKPPAGKKKGAAPTVVEKPAAGEEKPAAPAVVEKPANVVEKPPAVVEKPPAVVEKPPAVVEKPPAVVEKPAAVVEKPPAVVEKPAAVVEKPPAVVEKPPVSAKPGSVSSGPTQVVPVKTIEGGGTGSPPKAIDAPTTSRNRAYTGTPDMTPVHEGGPHPGGHAKAEAAAQLVQEIQAHLEREAAVRRAQRAGSLRTYRWWLQRGIEPPARAVYDRWFTKDEEARGVEDIRRRVREGPLDGIEVGRISSKDDYEKLAAWARATIHDWDDFYRHFVDNDDAGVRWRDGRWEVVTWEWGDWWPANVTRTVSEDPRITEILDPIRADVVAKTKREVAGRAGDASAFAPGSGARIAGVRKFRKGFVDRDLFTIRHQVRLMLKWAAPPLFYEITGVPVAEGFTLVGGADLHTSLTIHQWRAMYDRSSRPDTISEGRYDSEAPFTGYGPVRFPCILVRSESLIPG